MLASSRDIKIIRHGDVVSTNLLALELGKQGEAHGTVVIAEEQSGGRGRKGRDFASPLGGLYFSIILRPQTEPENVSFHTLAAGVACCKTIEMVSGLPVMLKWPNDVYIGHKKLGGILTEAAPYSHAEQKIPYLVVGIGLNINTRPEMFPDSLRKSIASLYCMQNMRYDLESIMTDIVLKLDRYSCNLERLRLEICNFWQQHDCLIGKKICWQAMPGQVIYGIGAGLMQDGQYQLRKANGDVVPIAGGKLSIVDNEKNSIAKC